MNKQASALFDTAACKQAWQRARAYTRTAPPLKALEDRIKRMEGIAYWYRLAIRVQGQAWLYPHSKAPSLRFDGLLRATPGFRIRPYEPPVVPMQGMYTLALYTESFARVPLPVGNAGLAEVPPCRPLKLEEGERGN